MSDNLPNHARKKASNKVRIDQLLVQRGLAPTTEQARRLIMAGAVRVNGVVIDKPGDKTARDAEVSVRAAPPFVSRGGLKLAAALDEFQINVNGLIAVDVGASTGGFTDCLLQRGAAHVFAVDVGYGELAWKLRTDPRVTTLERTNIRFLEQLPGGALADIAVIDASFISLKQTLPAALRLLQPAGQIVALVKPQFEAAREEVSEGGVVRDERVHRRVLEDVVRLAHSLALHVAGATLSPVAGPAGNIEFLVWLRREAGADAARFDVVDAIDNTLRRAARFTTSTTRLVDALANPEDMW